MARKQPKPKKAGKVKESKLNEAEDEAENESEDECKNSEGEDEGESESEDDDGDGSGSDGDHDDKDQDVALIKKMIAQYLGDDAKNMDKEEAAGMAALGKQAYAAHQKMGKKPDDAFHHAGEAMKLAYHMSKNAEDESETEAEDEDGDPPAPPAKGKKPAPKAPPPKGGGADDSDGDSDSSEDEGESEDESESEDEKKESNREKSLRKRLLEAEGRIAALAAKDKQRSVDGYINKKLKESKQPYAITKRFREAAGKIRYQADFDAKWKIFLEGVKNTVKDEVDFGVLMEKSVYSHDDESSTESKAKMDFSDCADDQD